MTPWERARKDLDQREGKDTRALANNCPLDTVHDKASCSTLRAFIVVESGAAVFYKVLTSQSPPSRRFELKVTDLQETMDVQEG